MCNRKKGFTLLELVVYLGILSIIFLIFSSSYNLIRNIRSDLGIKSDITKIHDFLVQAKMSSKNNEVKGWIIYDKDKKYIRYSSSKDKIDVQLNHVIIEQIYTSSGEEKLNINDRGIITTAGTIRIGSNGGEHTISITVSVGSDTINVKT